MGGLTFCSYSVTWAITCPVVISSGAAYSDRVPRRIGSVKNDDPSLIEPMIDAA
jgi:hypothetical protein